MQEYKIDESAQAALIGQLQMCRQEFGELLTTLSNTGNDEFNIGIDYVSRYISECNHWLDHPDEQTVEKSAQHFIFIRSCLGSIYFRLAQYTQSKNSYMTTLELAQNYDDSKDITKVLRGLAQACIKLEEDKSQFIKAVNDIFGSASPYRTQFTDEKLGEIFAEASIKNSGLPLKPSENSAVVIDEQPQQAITGNQGAGNPSWNFSPFLLSVQSQANFKPAPLDCQLDLAIEISRREFDSKNRKISWCKKEEGNPELLRAMEMSLIEEEDPDLAQAIAMSLAQESDETNTDIAPEVNVTLSVKEPSISASQSSAGFWRKDDKDSDDIVNLNIEVIDSSQAPSNTLSG